MKKLENEHIETTRTYTYDVQMTPYGGKRKVAFTFSDGELTKTYADQSGFTEDLCWEMNAIMLEQLKELKHQESFNKFQWSDRKEIAK